MAAVTGIKYDDGLPAISANCFPVRTFLRHDADEEADGAWLVAQRAEQRRRFKAILCTKPKTYARIKEERRRAEKQGTSITEQLQNADDQEEEEEKDVPVLDGFFLMRHCCVEDPSDLCSVNLSGKEMSDVKEEDLALFDNVAYVNASENFLPFEAFRGFPILRELEMPLNGLRSIKPKLEDYPKLEVLDVSYNNLSHEDILTLGLLPNLKVLHLTGNGLKTLPPNMGMPLVDENTNEETLRYSKLEILLLDDNKLEDVSVFAALAGLQCLKHLNLEKNELYYVPMLKSVEGKVVPNDSEKDARRLRHSAEKGGRRSAQGSARGSARGTRSLEPTPRRQLEAKDREHTTGAPQPTPVPTGENTIVTEGSGEQKGLEKNGNPVQPDLLKEDLTSLSRQITDIDLEKEVTVETVEEHMKGGQLPPFPDLRALNLAHNKIEDEEALLAVAAWPMLVELIIHNNPLTTENSGDPPLLQRFLGERLGIRIKRKTEADIKPHVEVKKKKSRHVTTVVPKIPKMAVDDLLMLEAPKPPTIPKPEKTRTQIHVDQQKPLPPIPASPVEGQSSWSQQGERSDEEERSGSPGKVKEETTDADAFFMTQVDEQEEEGKRKDENLKKSRRKHKKKNDNKDDKYKGYEILLDAEDDPNYFAPKDMHGNIKALKYALGHELVYRDPAARLDRISKPVEPYRKQELKSSPRVTQAQKKEAILTEMRDRVTTEEAGLDEVLFGGNRDLSRRFQDSDRLLSEIQRRYNAVRVNSMKEARDARKLIAGAKEDVARTKDPPGTRRVKMEV